MLNGSNATFHCNTIGNNAYWMINNETIRYSSVKQKYTARGFTFDHPETHCHQGYCNLTLHVLASEDTNQSLIECWVISSGYTSSDRSQKANLLVFVNFCK